MKRLDFYHLLSSRWLARGDKKFAKHLPKTFKRIADIKVNLDKEKKIGRADIVMADFKELEGLLMHELNGLNNIKRHAAINDFELIQYIRQLLTECRELIDKATKEEKPELTKIRDGLNNLLINVKDKVHKARQDAVRIRQDNELFTKYHAFLGRTKTALEIKWEQRRLKQQLKTTKKEYSQLKNYAKKLKNLKNPKKAMKMERKFEDHAKKFIVVANKELENIYKITLNDTILLFTMWSDLAFLRKYLKEIQALGFPEDKLRELHTEAQRILSDYQTATTEDKRDANWLYHQSKRAA